MPSSPRIARRFVCPVSTLLVSIGVLCAAPALAAFSTFVTNVNIAGQGTEAIVLTGATFNVTLNYQLWNDASCPGCFSQIAVGIDNTGQDCAYDDVPGVEPGASGSATVTLTAPASPGLYEVRWTRDLQFDCAGALANYPNAVQNVIGTISVGSSTGFFAAVRHVSLNGGGTSIATLPGGVVSVNLDYTIWNPSGCPSCIDQIVLGIGNVGGDCAYDDIPATYPGSSGNTTVNLTAPASPGTYEIKWTTDAQFQCVDAVANYPGNPKTKIATFTVVAVPGFSNANSGPIGYPSDGVAWGDYDNDGDPDLLITGTPGGSFNRLFRNDGPGEDGWTWGAPFHAGLESMGRLKGAAWGDYDNDGDLDVILVSYSGPKRLLRNDGGTFSIAPSSPLDTGLGNGVAWADYDNDGDLDLYFANDDPSKLFRNDGGTWVDVTSGLLGSNHAKSVAWGDYDNDGDLDLYLSRNPGPSYLFRNNGGSFVSVQAGVIGGAGNGQGVAWGDYDNDGDLDLYAVRDALLSRLFRNDGGTFVDATTSALGSNANSSGVAWGDYNNDGALDLFVTRYANSANTLLLNGGGRFVDAGGALAVASQCYSTAWADFNRDGNLDLYVVDGFNPSILFSNAGVGNHWLQLKLQGVVSNRAAIGARVRVVAGGVARTAEISGGSGLYSQNSLIAQFGLGAATAVDSVIIRWPSGIVQLVSPFPWIDREVTIIEGALLAADRALTPAFELVAAVPNPFQRSTRIDYALPSAGRVKLTVHDVQGRRVATLADGGRSAGQHSAMWNGLNADGGRARTGVYFVRLAIAGVSEAKVRKLVMTR